MENNPHIAHGQMTYKNRHRQSIGAHIIATVSFVAVFLLATTSTAWAWSSTTIPAGSCDTPYQMGAGLFSDYCANTGPGPLYSYSVSGNTWSELDSNNTVGAYTDFNGGQWEIRSSASCAAGTGLVYDYFYDRATHSMRWGYIDDSTCVSTLSVGDACVNGFGDANCTDSDIHAANDKTFYIYDDSTSSFFAQDYTYSGAAVTMMAAFNEVGCAAHVHDFWFLDEDANLYRVREAESDGGFCLWQNPAESTLPGGDTGCGSDGKVAGAYGVTTDFMICSSDVYQWVASTNTWHATGLGACTNNSGSYGTFEPLGYNVQQDYVYCYSNGDGSGTVQIYLGYYADTNF